MNQKVAFVTGSGKGIGKGIAVALAQAGYDVAVHYQVSKERAEDTVEQVERLGRKAVLIQGNVRDLEDIKVMFQQFQSQFDRLDVLVNNAGVTRMSPFLETTPELFEEVVNTDLRGVYFCAQSAAKLMVNQGIPGVIVNISSNHAVGCWPNATVYAAAKAAVNKLTMNMALDLAPYGIRAVGIAPGYTELEWFTNEMKESYVRKVEKKIPAGRFLTTDEVGEAVVYLASEKASYITGTTLFMDGGALLPVVASNNYGG
jgi:NAD(P)-dependent dehydrogenase (short-subunit alcohol dehydrogenase family)